MVTKKRGASSDLRLAGAGILNPAFPGVDPVHAALAKRSKNADDRVLLARAEMRLGLPPGALGTTHTVNEVGHVLDGEGHIVGLTVANPGGIGDWLKIILLDYAFGGAAPVAATTPLFVGLGTGTFTGGTTDIGYLQNGITNEVTTANWTNYARVSFANNGTNWSGATGTPATQVAQKQNATAISFTANATVTGTGPTPTWWFIARTLATNAAADIYAVGTISSGSAAVVNGAAVSIAVGALTITIT